MSQTTQPVAERIAHGIDMDAHEKFLAFAKENPDAVQFILRAQGTDEGRVLHTRSTTGPYSLGGEEIDRIARDYTYHFGGHKEVEDHVGFVDPTDRPEAMEVALAALTGCINGAISMSAVQAGVDLDEIETNITVDWDPSVLLGLTETTDQDGAPTDMWGDLQIDIEVSGDDIDEETLEQVREWVDRSGVYNLVALAHKATPNVSMMADRAI